MAQPVRRRRLVPPAPIQSGVGPPPPLTLAQELAQAMTPIPPPGLTGPISQPGLTGPISPPGYPARPPTPDQAPSPGIPTHTQAGTPGFQAQLARYQQLKAQGDQVALDAWLKSRGGTSAEARANFERAVQPAVPTTPVPAPPIGGPISPPGYPAQDQRPLPNPTLAPPPGLTGPVPPPGYQPAADRRRLLDGLVTQALRPGKKRRP